MSELSDRVDLIRSQKAAHDQEARERAMGKLFQVPFEKDAPLIHEFIRSYSGPWETVSVWAPDDRDRIFEDTVHIPSDLKGSKHTVRSEECVTVAKQYDDYSEVVMWVLRDGRVAGSAKHEWLLNRLAELLA